MSRGEHAPVPQADSSVRPLPRRAERMARPARVRMRRRKPWVLARRRLFGWNVRLLTRVLQLGMALKTTMRRAGTCGAVQTDCPTVRARGERVKRCWRNSPRRAVTNQRTVLGRNTVGSELWTTLVVLARTLLASCTRPPARCNTVVANLGRRPRIVLDAASGRHAGTACTACG